MRERERKKSYWLQNFLFPSQRDCGHVCLIILFVQNPDIRLIDYVLKKLHQYSKNKRIMQWIFFIIFKKYCHKSKRMALIKDSKELYDNRNGQLTYF